jgi:hypothetical protein
MPQEKPKAPKTRRALELLLCLCLGAGCKRGLASTVTVTSDKAGQLVSGFYEVEDNAWRWTHRRFEILFPAPMDAARAGGTADLDVALPATMFARFGAQTITCSLDGVAASPVTLSAAGRTHVRFAFPPFTQEVARLACQVEKVIPPGGGDPRELGIIVHRASLQAR